jgi:hypothetical protein
VARDHDHHGRLVADAGEHIEPRHVRQAQVEQRHVGTSFAPRREGPFTRRRQAHRVPGAFEETPVVLGQHRFVVDDQEVGMAFAPSTA